MKFPEENTLVACKEDPDLAEALTYLDTKLADPGFTLYILRHGQSEANLANCYGGKLLDVPITESGEADAKQAGDVLSRELANTGKSSAAYLLIDTGMKRTMKTAELLNETLAEPLARDTHAALDERNWGALTGAPKSDERTKYIVSQLSGDDNYDKVPDRATIDAMLENAPQHLPLPKHSETPETPLIPETLSQYFRNPPNAQKGESLAEFHKRTIIELAEMVKTLPEDTTPVLVAHKGTIQAIGLYLTGDRIQEPANGVIHTLNRGENQKTELSVITLERKAGTANVSQLEGNHAQHQLKRQKADIYYR